MSGIERSSLGNLNPVPRFGAAWRLVCSGCSGEHFAPEERDRAQRMEEIHNAFCGDAELIPVD